MCEYFVCVFHFFFILYSFLLTAYYELVDWVRTKRRGNFASFVLIRLLNVLSYNEETREEEGEKKRCVKYVTSAQMKFVAHLQLKLLTS